MRTWTDEQLQNAVKISKSYTEILENLNLRAAGGNFKSMKKHIARLNIDTSHLEGRKIAISKLLERRARTNDEIFCEDSKVHRHTVVNRLLKEKIIPYICSACNCKLFENKDGLWFWNNKPCVLTLEHKNGKHNDNRLVNLCWLCPNCHSQTETFAGRKNTNTIKRLKVDLNSSIPKTDHSVSAILLKKNCKFCDKGFKPNRKSVV